MDKSFVLTGNEPVWYAIAHLIARFLSFVAAATHNWLLNRHYTFV
jgi:putative flippase GtrA